MDFKCNQCVISFTLKITHNIKEISSKSGQNKISLNENGCGYHFSILF